MVALAAAAGCGGATPDGSGDGAAVETAFLAAAADPSATFRVRTSTTVEVVGLDVATTITIASDLQVRGDDATGEVTVTGSDGTSTTAEIVQLDGQAWARFDGGTWAGPTPIEASPIGASNPFLALDSGDITDTGPSDRFAPGLRALEDTGAPPAALTQLVGDVAGADVTGYTRTFHVRRDGTPVASTTTLTLYGEIGPAGARQPATVTVTSTSRFSEWGEPVDVVAPAS